jgi:hypothetical protein
MLVHGKQWGVLTLQWGARVARVCMASATENRACVGRSRVARGVTRKLRAAQCGRAFAIATCVFKYAMVRARASGQYCGRWVNLGAGSGAGIIVYIDGRQHE